MYIKHFQRKLDNFITGRIFRVIIEKSTVFLWTITNYKNGLYRHIW